MAERNHYKVLQVDSYAEHEIIVAAYRRLAMIYHPDSNPKKNTTERMKEINEAFAILGNSQKRADYDKRLLIQGTNVRGMHNFADRSGEFLCPSCKHLLQVDSLFCSQCGVNIRQYSQQTKEKSETTQRPSGSRSQDSGASAWRDGIICPRCGKINEKYAEICIKCYKYLGGARNSFYTNK